MARVKKIMLTDVPTLKKEAKIDEAVKLLAQKGSGCVVITEDKKPIGIVTELDIVRSVISKGRSTKDNVGSVMVSPVTQMMPEMKLDEALKIIDTKRFRRYPVTENGELIGLVTKKDIVNAISENVRFHRNIQNIVLVIFVLFEFFIFLFSEYFWEIPFLVK
ncbi:CBS domain-containing protein [Candidatus Woesearchaeota archaeon]|nr:CBS domain-containing protein [Candidatus Woesearchaeota archaeon]